MQKRFYYNDKHQSYHNLHIMQPEFSLISKEQNSSSVVLETVCSLYGLSVASDGTCRMWDAVFRCVCTLVLRTKVLGRFQWGRSEDAAKDLRTPTESISSLWNWHTFKKWIVPHVSVTFTHNHICQKPFSMYWPISAAADVIQKDIW